MRVVLDTNVLIAGIFSRGITNEIIARAEQGVFTFCFTPATIDELSRVLQRSKFIKELNRRNISVNEIITKYLSLADFINNNFSPRIVPLDRGDDKIVGCAVLYQANYIVTGDHHLLSLKEIFLIPIVTPRKFLTIL